MSGGRISCSRCGANNFDTVTVCWKCNTPLGGAPSSTPLPSNYAAQSIPGAPASFTAPPAQSFAERAVYQPAAAVASAMGNQSAANRAAFWLGVLMPYFGLPIGLAFVMCDDRRRQEVGRICIMWSLISGAVHVLLMVIAAIGMREYFAFAMNTLRGQLQRTQGLGGGSGELGL